MGRKLKKILYITYLGILEPIPKSQVLPYLMELSGEYKIYLLSFEKKEFLKKDALLDAQKKLSDKGIEWIRLTYHKWPRILSSFYDILTGFLTAIFAVIKYRISIVHARSNIPIAIGHMLKLMQPVKLIYDRRGIMGEDHTEHSGWKKDGLLYRLSIWFEKKAIRKSDAIVVLSDRVNTFLKDNIVFKHKPSITTIPCCVNLDLFRFGNFKAAKKELGLSDKFVFVYSGSIGTYNLLNEMFDFFREARKIITNAYFLILTAHTKIIEEVLKKRTDIDAKDVYVNYVIQDRLPYYLSAADVGLVFRRSSATAIAASPTKLGEYLACGLPVISTPKIGDTEEIINLNNIGVVLNTCENDEYRKAAAKIFYLTGEKEVLKARCRKVAEDIFSLKRGVDFYSQIYKGLN